MLIPNDAVIDNGQRYHNMLPMLLCPGWAFCTLPIVLLTQVRAPAVRR
jgi:hypothetical protein